ncbi:MAG TPA: hypothetical protein PK961_00175 [bacterium]|nr:hypothetical protein [bacterium]
MRNFMLLLLVAGLLWACDLFSSDEQYHKQMMDVAQRAADCEEMILHQAVGPEGGYSDTLDDLLRFDATLTDDPQIAIAFGPMTGSGYSFAVRRKGVSAAVVCTAADGCRLSADDDKN